MAYRLARSGGAGVAPDTPLGVSGCNRRVNDDPLRWPECGARVAYLNARMPVLDAACCLVPVGNEDMLHSVHAYAAARVILHGVIDNCDTRAVQLDAVRDVAIAAGRAIL